jgi:molybdopterin-binding protein
MDTLSVDQAATLLHVHPKRVRNLARSGKLPAVRVGRRWLFHRDRIEALLGMTPAATRPLGIDALSARNHLNGRIQALRMDGLMAEVTLDVGGQPLVAMITRSSAERLALAVGDSVLAVIKSTEVMVAKP